MSETLRDLVVSLSLNSDNFTRNIKSINKQIQEAESAFRLASAGVKNFETTTAGLSFKLSTSVGKAGGGWKGFLTVLKSPAVWFAVAAAVIAGTVALADYVSGAKQAREALAGMEDTAKQWKDTAAETFYRNSEQ